VQWAAVKTYWGAINVPLQNPPDVSPTIPTEGKPDVGVPLMIRGLDVSLETTADAGGLAKIIARSLASNSLDSSRSIRHFRAASCFDRRRVTLGTLWLEKNIEFVYEEAVLLKER